MSIRTQLLFYLLRFEINFEKNNLEEMETDFTNFREALTQLNKKPLEIEYDEDFNCMQNLLEIKLLIKKGDFNHALKLIKSSQRKHAKHAVISPQDNLDSIYSAHLILKEQALYALGKHNDAAVVLEKLLDPSNQITDPYTNAIILKHMGTNYLRLSEFDAALSYLDKSLDIFGKINNDLERAKILNNIAIIHRNLGNYQEAMDNYELTLEIALKLQHQVIVAVATKNIGNIYLDLGDLEHALINYRKAKQMYEKQDNKIELAYILTNLGLIYKSLGDLKQAEYYFLSAMKIAKAKQNPVLENLINNNLGLLDMIRGNVKSALSYLEISKKGFEKSSNKVYLAKTLLNLGLVNRSIGDTRQAKKHLLHSFSLRQEIGNPVDIAEIIYQIIINEIEDDSLEHATKYLEKLKALAQRTNNKSIINRAKLAEASILRNSSVSSERLMAHELLDDILTGEDFEFEMKVFAIVSLCEYLYLETTETNSEQYLNQLVQAVDKLFEISSDNASNLITAETLIVKCKLAIVQGMAGDAMGYLAEAKNIAENNNLEQTMMKIQLIDLTLQDIIYGLTEDTDENNITKRMEQLNIEDYLKDLHFLPQREYPFVQSKEADDKRKQKRAQKKDLSSVYSDMKNILVNQMHYTSDFQISTEKFRNILQKTSKEIKLIYSTHLYLEKLENQNYELIDTDKINLNEKLEERIEYFSELISNKRIHINLQIDTNINFQSDKLLLEKVIDNILHNAIKYSPVGGVISIFVKESDSFSGYTVTIDNQGPIIVKEYRETIFNKGFQIPNDERLNHGLGIGLTYCREALQLMGEEIWIESPLPKNDYGVRVNFSIHL